MISKKQIFTYLNNSFDLRPSSHGWYRMINPFDKKNGECFGIHMNYNKAKCFRTGYDKKIIDFISDILGDANKLEGIQETDYIEANFRDYKVRSKVKLPEFFSLLPSDKLYGSWALDYLNGRGVNNDTIYDKSIGYCYEGEWAGYIIFPVINNNLLEFFYGRNFLHNHKHKFPDADKFNIGKSEVIYNEDALYMFEDVYLGEGVFDALACGISGICCFGWSISEKQLTKIRNSTCTYINIVPDKGFYKKALVLASKIIHYKKVRITNLDIFEGEDKDVDVSALGGISDLIFEELTWSKIIKKIKIN